MPYLNVKHRVRVRPSGVRFTLSNGLYYSVYEAKQTIIGEPSL